MSVRNHIVVLVCILGCSFCSYQSVAQNDAGGAEKSKVQDSPAATVPTPAGKKPSSSKSGTLSEIFAQVNDQPAIRRAGLRAGLLRQIQVTASIVVIVKDANSYLLAISNWENAQRFPILWDDGTAESHENIARFVRAFKPEHVIELVGSSGSNWVGDRGQKQAVFESVLSKAINESKPDWKTALDEMAQSGIVSPGIVVTDVNDSAWPAALALCAGRFQPILFVEKPSSVYQPMSVPIADALERAIEHGVKDTGHSWDEVGDDIDAITLALNTGTMIKSGSGPRDRLATSDRIGRKDSNGTGKRWAWCGQIIGNESRTTYQAMCALFLSIDNAFVWDGYSSQGDWALYDGTEAGKTLEDAGLIVELNDQPKNTLNDWKHRMVRSVGQTVGENGSSGLILMNSKGASNVFDLPGVVDGQGKPGHIPMLDVPSAMHIVHSFSLQSPMNRATVGGRLLERGVYVYAGSVDEPYLNGFVPTPVIARRLAGSVAFATAIHYDDNEVWKITVLGDPLVTFGPNGRRVKSSIKVLGSVDLSERYKSRLKAGDYEGAISDLSILGRDDAVARIAAALIMDKPEAFGPKVAQGSIPSLFRAGEYATMIDAYDRLDSMGQVDHLMQDLLWLSSPYLLSHSAGDVPQRSRIEALLRANIRANQRIHDAEDLAMSIRMHSIQSAVGILESLRPTLNESQTKMLERAIQRVRK